MKLNLISKGDGVAIQSHKFLLHLQQTEQFERVCYPEARERMSSACLHI